MIRLGSRQKELLNLIAILGSMRFREVLDHGFRKRVIISLNYRGFIERTKGKGNNCGWRLAKRDDWKKLLR